MRFFLLTVILLLGLSASAQRQLRGVVADSLTKQVLPFATLQLGAQRASMILELKGQYNITVPDSITSITISYVGHRQKQLLVADLKEWDTIFLVPVTGQMNEVVIRSQTDRIRKIINSAVRRKDDHNPDHYDQYECQIYYKMVIDILPFGDPPKDSTKRKERKPRNAEEERKMHIRDSLDEVARQAFMGPHKHLMFSETVSRRWYQRPHQMQETILASKFSGLKKTYFSNKVTDVLPFHVYRDYINLNGREYINPIARGWQKRYRFFIEDEIISGNDTVFILSFGPESKAAFNFLTGLVYINSNGYAISHFIAATDTSQDRSIQFEQKYQYIDGKWFPRELNYDVNYKKTPTAYTQFNWNGHSVIDSVSFKQKAYSFNKSQTVVMHDSVDLRSASDWERFRRDSITVKEANTYHFMDSVSERHHIEKLVSASGKIAIGRWPVGNFDLDLNRLVAKNQFEGFRLGAGLYTNEILSKYYSIGGWAGYGFDDHTWKYGGSGTIYFKGNRDNYLDLSYEKNYRNPGQVQIHPEMAANGLRYWVLGLVDLFEGYKLTLNLRKNYMQFRPEVSRQEVKPLYADGFLVGGKQINSFKHSEASFGFRYAYGEKRFPAFGRYLPVLSKYPVAYTRVSGGRISSGDYRTNYIQALAGVTWKVRTIRWGYDIFRLEGGMVRSLNNQPLPRSFLLAGNGIKINGLNYYSERGFSTMQPFDFYSDRYLAFFYKHDFDKFLWDLKWSKPYLSLAHNMALGSLGSESRLANTGIHSYSNGYHESGILVNQLLRRNVRVGDVGLTGGYFYPWSTLPVQVKNGTWVFSINVLF
jgi:hypothetical protein